MWVQESGKHFTHACCDCGSAHNVKLVVLNEEEVEVTYYKNQKATADFRAMPTFGVLISESLSRALPMVMDHLGRKQHKKARRILKAALRREVEFQQLYASGDFLG
jgi:hypothetical protein